MPTLLVHRLVNRVRRVRAMDGAKIAYKLGHGGTNPKNPTPASSTKGCDCSGLAAWGLELNRAPKPSRPWWIETTNVHRDITGPQKAFVRITTPVPGCVVVYPDKGNSQGHIAIVTEVELDANGKVKYLRGVDCSMGMQRKVGSAIWERDLTNVFKGAVYGLLREDFQW